MQLGPVRVPGRGHRALGTHRGQPPAQPTPARAQRSRGRVSLRAKGATGRAGTRRAGAVPRSQEPRGARGDVPGARAAGCHPCAVRARAVPSAGSGLAAHTRVPTPRSGHTRTDTRGPSSSVPRHFPTPGWTQRPCSPPAPCPDLCTNPPGGRGEAIKREPGAALAPEPGTGEWGHPRRGSCWEGDGVGTPVPPPVPHIVRSALSPAMKVSLLFLLACTAVLALGASKGRGLRRAGVGAQGDGGTRGGHSRGTPSPQCHQARPCRGRHVRGAKGAGAEGSGAGPESLGHDQGRL